MSIFDLKKRPRKLWKKNIHVKNKLNLRQKNDFNFASVYIRNVTKYIPERKPLEEKKKKKWAVKIYLTYSKLPLHISQFIAVINITRCGRYETNTSAVKYIKS